MLWLISIALVPFVVSASMLAREKYPQIISHRGASGYVPEHSLQAYQLAINLQTDYIEPDLCLSKDGIFVAMHDLLLDDTTNVADLPQFADRKTTKVVDGANMTGYFISDFTYAELQELRLKQRMTQRTTIFNVYFTIPKLDDIMSLVQSNYASTGHTIGIYPELKHPSYFKQLGFAMEDMLLDSLQKGGYVVYGAEVPNNMSMVVPVVVQCFEAASLQYLHQKASLPLIQLLETQAPLFWSKENLTMIAGYAQGVGPNKIDFGVMSLGHAKSTIDLIHTSGLYIHPWTFRADSDIGPQFKGNFYTEQVYFYCCLGIDAVFSEFPDRTRETLDVIANYTNSGKNRLQSPCPIDCRMYSSPL